MHILILPFLMSLFFALPAAAQLYDDEGAVIAGEGVRGTYSREQLRPRIYRFMPGEFIHEYSNHIDDRLYHAFQVELVDGSVYELEFWALSGDLFDIEVERLGDSKLYPPNMFDEDKARDIARVHIQNKTNSGNMKAKVKSASIDVYKRQLVYRVRVRKLIAEFDVLVDALNGQILRTEEL